jgi:hypothetical protein
VSVQRARIGQLLGPIDQHSAALASHAAASGQQIKKRFPQVPWKIGDRHVVLPPGASVFQAVSNGVKRTGLDIAG